MQPMPAASMMQRLNLPPARPAPVPAAAGPCRRQQQAAPRRGCTASRASAGPGAGQLDLVTFSFIVDDLVFGDGSTLMAQPGGGGPQTAWGFQLVCGPGSLAGSVGLAAEVGHDLPPACAAWLDACGVHRDGLVPSRGGRPTPRAWQVNEDDGRRAEIWRTLPVDDIPAMLRPDLTALPPAYRAARAYHVALNPSSPGLNHLRQLRAACPSGLVSVETFTAATHPLSAQELQQLVSLCDIFSPNESEAVSMLGLAAAAAAVSNAPGSASQKALAAGSVRLHSGDRAAGGGGGGRGGADAGAEAGALLQLTRPFLEAGARLVAVRRGPVGAVVHSADAGAWQVPAVAGTRVVDTTGCGNAFCGALLAAMAAGEELSMAGAWGCVAGSLMAEHRGVPQAPPAELHGEALRRLEALLPRVRRLE